MTNRLSAALVVALLLAGAVGGTAAGDTGVVEPDRVVVDVAVEADGDARWRVAYRFRLSDGNATAAFEELRADVEENTSAYRERFAARMNRTARAAENATGREMAVDDGRLTVTEPFASGFETDYRFVVRGPDGYRLVSVAPEPAAREDGTATAGLIRPVVVFHR